MGNTAITGTMILAPAHMEMAAAEVVTEAGVVAAVMEAAGAVTKQANWRLVRVRLGLR